MPNRRTVIKSMTTAVVAPASVGVFSLSLSSPAHAQVIEGISLALSAYQTFSKRGDGGMSAILKNVSTKLDLINQQMGLLADRLDIAISEIRRSESAIIAAMHRAEMRSFTSEIISQQAQYRDISSVRSGLQQIRDYNNGRDIQRIRDSTLNALNNIISPERVSLIQPIDLITISLGIGLFALSDWIIGNDEAVRKQVVNRLSKTINGFANFDLDSGVLTYVNGLRASLEKEVDSLILHSGAPPLTRFSEKLGIRSKIDQPPAIKSFLMPTIKTIMNDGLRKPYLCGPEALVVSEKYVKSGEDNCKIGTKNRWPCNSEYCDDSDTIQYKYDCQKYWVTEMIIHVYSFDRDLLDISGVPNIGDGDFGDSVRRGKIDQLLVAARLQNGDVAPSIDGVKNHTERPIKPRRWPIYLNRNLYVVKAKKSYLGSEVSVEFTDEVTVNTGIKYGVIKNGDLVTVRYWENRAVDSLFSIGLIPKTESYWKTYGDLIEATDYALKILGATIDAASQDAVT
jgi:hypothetical protein